MKKRRSGLTAAVLDVFITFPTNEFTIPDIQALGLIENIKSINGAVSRLVEEGLLIRTKASRGKSGFSKWKMIYQDVQATPYRAIVKSPEISKVVPVAPKVERAQKPTLINRCYHLAMAKRHLCVEDVCDTFELTTIKAISLMLSVMEEYGTDIRVNMSLDVKH